ncbi:UNKNOWN [Stylonychia lemnae]|uniref:Uncharacterized protein n=1 Tax=Stylonychia lemnae TaxID=5949 RepID=A0A078ASP8_STYLE|nr:UNKNOWN [Stylonychia lemnae]|eukprot:CDW85026.1 UNKNOWN [Stylonychia lemnae]
MSEIDLNLKIKLSNENLYLNYEKCIQEQDLFKISKFQSSSQNYIVFLRSPQIVLEDINSQDGYIIAQRDISFEVAQPFHRILKFSTNNAQKLMKHIIKSTSYQYDKDKLIYKMNFDYSQIQNLPARQNKNSLINSKVDQTYTTQDYTLDTLADHQINSTLQIQDLTQSYPQHENWSNFIILDSNIQCRLKLIQPRLRFQSCKNIDKSVQKDLSFIELVQLTKSQFHQWETSFLDASQLM